MTDQGVRIRIKGGIVHVDSADAAAVRSKRWRVHTNPSSRRYAAANIGPRVVLLGT